MTRDTQYNYKLGKGCGLIEETLALLSVYQKGMTKDELAGYVHQYNTLSRSTEKRSQDIVRIVFYSRFMRRNPDVAFWLKTIREKGLMLAQFNQLLMLYCARDNAVFYDYVMQEINVLREEQKAIIPKDNSINYVKKIAETGDVKWGEKIQNRLASYLKTLLVEFNFADKKGTILPFDIANFTVLYLMHELHFAGLSDVAIWNHEDWQLFGLDKYKVLEKIMEMNLKGGYIAQSTGDLMTISWNYQTMEEFINGTL
jgi:TPR repeat protein